MPSNHAHYYANMGFYITNLNMSRPSRINIFLGLADKMGGGGGGGGAAAPSSPASYSSVFTPLVIQLRTIQTQHYITAAMARMYIMISI